MCHSLSILFSGSGVVSQIASDIALPPAHPTRAPMHLCTGMYCMPVLQEQKPVTKKLLFLEVPLGKIIKPQSSRNPLYAHHIPDTPNWVEHHPT